MAQIVHADGAETLNHEGVAYQADEHGVFQVPGEVADYLVRFPFWHHFTGVPKDKVAANVVGQLQSDVAKLRADVDALLAAKTDPAKK